MRSLSGSLSPRAAVAWLALAAVAIATALVVHGPIVQPEGYHAFADRRSWGGVPNTLDVASNLAFLLVGIVGLRRLLVPGALAPGVFADSFGRRSYAWVFAALVAVAFGSAYYHWAPTTARLFWDRLPIAVVLCGVLGIAVAERLDLRWGRRLFRPIVATGVLSTLVWRQSADLRLYVAVQALTFVALPLLLSLRPRMTPTRDWIWMIALYGAAKVCEVADRPIYDALGLVSGHTLKHLLAAAAVGRLLPHLRKRTLR